MKKGYGKKELEALGAQRTFTGAALAQVAFPLGGIGAGNVSLTGTGGLADWEIFNRPNIGGRLPNTFPLVWAKEQGEEPVTRVLMALRPGENVRGGGGDPAPDGGGFPHMDSCVFRGAFPFAHIDFASRKLPVKVSLDAYSPFVPGDADASGYPAAVLEYTLTNTRKKAVSATVAWSLFNAVGMIGVAAGDKNLQQVEQGLGQNVNTAVDEGGVRGLHFTSNKWPREHPRFGSMALTTPEKSVTIMKSWSREGWFNPRHELWDTFSATGLLPDHDFGPSDDNRSDAGAVGVRVKLKPGESKTVTFHITWHFPNFEKYWGGGSCCNSPSCQGNATYTAWPNYYASQFDSALDVAKKLHANGKKLRAQSAQFRDALFGSTLPPHVLDAVSSQMAILRTATCVRLADGTFYGWEGCAPGHGCCEGSCTHVWNYQQALPFLFPELERSMRAADYRHNMRENGSMCFRLSLPIGSPPNDFHACGDGQMGGIIKTYRDWKISGDDAWLRGLWPDVKKSLEYAWTGWDPDKDGVMTEIQHNTYDIEFLGPNPMMGCFYLGALLAGAEMADYLGEPEKAAEYREVFQKGSAWMDANLFNGDFYIQQYDPEKAPVHQFGAGCLSDQVLGQWMASLSGLGYVLKPANIRKTLRAIFKHNWRDDLSDHANAQRVYAQGDEAGLLLCSWPNGGRPAIPFVYSDEVWTGIEYQVASHCILEGLVTEGLSIVKGVRDRHDGIARNPWDEFECGHHYARAMASYGLLLALSGFSFDAGAGRMGFAPKIHEKDFRTFWTLGDAWGTYAQKGAKAELTVLHGTAELASLDLAFFDGAKKATVKAGGKAVAATLDKGRLTLARRVRLKQGDTLTVSG
jgi:non-lysosomal glucosylceramidase